MTRTASEICAKYPDRVPVFVRYGLEVTRSTTEKLRNKFLVPQMLTAAQLYVAIRNHVAVAETDALFFAFGVSDSKTMISMPEHATLRRIYDDFHAPDRFLYLHVDMEETLG